MALPVEDRAELAVQLLASLDEQIADGDPTALQRAWGEEMVRRSEQVVNGEAETVTWDDVLVRVAEHHNGR
jgi:putative addiction module component (TIGR02574 family)